MTDPIRDTLGSLTGQTIPGGCDTCNADQRMAQERPGVYVLQVMHDDDCPTLARLEGR